MIAINSTSAKHEQHVNMIIGFFDLFNFTGTKFSVGFARLFVRVVFNLSLFFHSIYQSDYLLDTSLQSFIISASSEVN